MRRRHYVAAGSVWLLTFSTVCRCHSISTIPWCNCALPACRSRANRQRRTHSSNRRGDWDDDFDASVAAHFVARRQATPQATLEWNERALQHAEAVDDRRVAALLPSLGLNLAESWRISREPVNAVQQIKGEPATDLSSEA